MQELAAPQRAQLRRSFADLVHHERTIGVLLDKIRRLEQELARKERQLEEQVRRLAALGITGPEESPAREELAQLPLSPEHPPRTVLSSVAFRKGGAGGITVREERGSGPHVVSLMAHGVSTGAFRAVSASFRAEGGRFLKLRVRERHAPRNRAEAVIDLVSGASLGALSADPGDGGVCAVSPEPDGWWRVELRASLTASDAPVEIELVSLASPGGLPEAREGQPRRAYSVRGVAVTKAASTGPARP